MKAGADPSISCLWKWMGLIRPKVILIAATNRPDVLDPGATLPGRFDRQVVVNRPDLRGRLPEISKVHTQEGSARRRGT